MTPIEEIKEKFDKVIVYSQSGIDNPQTDKLFGLWADAKRDIIEAFGGKYIYEFPEKITFELTEDAKNDRIQNFINYLWDLGYEELGRFLDYQRNGFYKNGVVEEYKLFDSKGTVITKGTKLVKAFKYFIKNEAILNKLQSKASQIIQENKVEGTLCLSVHPLDYLSISENTYNWRSCHALDGEYCAGNLSYMMDSSTIVCYLRGDNEVKLPHFPDDVLWNSKKWRVLLYLSNDWKMIFAGKQYPFATASGMQLLLDKFNSNIKSKPNSNRITRYDKRSHWANWSDYAITSFNRDDVPDKNHELHIDFNFDYVPVSGALVKLNELVTDKDGSKHFNDVLKSSCYKPMYTYLITKNLWGNDYYCNADLHTHFDIGGYTYCLRCGKEEVVESCSTMMCYDCELAYGISENDNFGFCKHCGCRLEVDKAYYVSEDIYCDDCYEHYTERCANCGDSFLREDMIYDEKSEKYFCEWCHDH